jgi:hypothetical protein
VFVQAIMRRAGYQILIKGEGRMRYFAMIVAGALLVAADMPPLAAPNWIAGAWIEQKGDRWAEEYWTGARGGMQMGSSRSGRGATLRSWEFARIAPDVDGRLAYFASPLGKTPVIFRMTAQDERSVTFENPAHDYPQRIRYWREGALLKAEISGAGGAKAMTWTYRPMGG